MSEEVQFHIHNTTKDRLTRTARVVAPGNPKTRLYLAGGAIAVLRGRPFPVTESIVRRLASELIEQERRGRCKVTDLKGRTINLTTFQVAAAPTAEEPKLLPAPPKLLPAPETAPQLPPADTTAPDDVSDLTDVPVFESTEAAVPEAAEPSADVVVPAEDTPQTEEVAETPEEETAAVEEASVEEAVSAPVVQGGSSQHKKKRR